MNSIFFPVKASNRRHKNRLSSIQNAAGVTLEGPRINVSNTRDLAKDFTADEITCDLKQMHPTKALGSDSMPPLFFQHHRHIFGPFITRALLDALNSSQNS